MKLRKDILLLLVLTLSLGTVLAACSGKNTPDDTDSAITKDNGRATGEIQDGGTVTLSMFSAPEGIFNPILSQDKYEKNVIQYFIFESLVHLDTTLSWKPHLAKDWYYENNQKTLVMELRNDVLWHDGERFTAHDVKFTYDAIAHPDYTGPHTNYIAEMIGLDEFKSGEAEEFAGVEATDDYTVKFHFKEPNVLALRDASFMIIPKHVYEKHPVRELKNAPETLDYNKLIGTGPFKASEYLAGEYYKVERFQNYWQGTPYLDEIVWLVVNQDVAPDLLAQGEIQVITTPTGVRASDVQFVSSIPGIKINESPSFGYDYLGFKLAYRTQEDVENNVYHPDNWIPNKKLQSVELRQAIAYAIDRQGIVDGLLEGYGIVLNAPFPPASWAFDASVVNESPFNPDKAKELLASAGYEDVNGDGFLEDPNGNPLVLRLDYPTGNRVRELTAPIIKQQLEVVGLKIDLRAPREPGSHLEAIRTDEEGMDLYLAGWEISEADPDPKGIWDITAPYNYSRWNNAHSQDLLDAAVQAPDASDPNYRMKKYKEWAAYISEQLPAVFLYSANMIIAYDEKVQGIIEGPDHIYRDLHKWHITD